jgi:hypothetical protein
MLEWAMTRRFWLILLLISSLAAPAGAPAAAFDCAHLTTSSTPHDAECPHRQPADAVCFCCCVAAAAIPAEPMSGPTLPVVALDLDSKDPALPAGRRPSPDPAPPKTPL